MAEAPDPAKPYKSLLNTHTVKHTWPHSKAQRGYCGWKLAFRVRERDIPWLVGDPSHTPPPPASNANEPLVPRLHRGKCGGLAWGPKRQWWVCLGRKADSWGRRLNWTGAVLWQQSLAQRPQQMAAEQRGCRETLLVQSEWLSVESHRQER